MISHMTLADANTYPALFESMYEDRKKIFVDRLRWDLDHNGRKEVDNYDTSDAAYLILNDSQSGLHLGSVRLLPTTKGHILSDVFPFLCEGEVPTGNRVWEITRLVVSPDAKRRDRLMIRNMLGRAMIEYGLAVGIDYYTCVCEMGFLSQLLASGWHCEPLGLPQEFQGSVVGALKIRCDGKSLTQTEDIWRYDRPVLQMRAPSKIAA